MEGKDCRRLLNVRVMWTCNDVGDRQGDTNDSDRGSPFSSTFDLFPTNFLTSSWAFFNFIGFFMSSAIAHSSADAVVSLPATNIS